MIKQIKEFFKNEEGAETLEYVVIVAIIILLGSAIYNQQMGAVITNAFTQITDAITPAAGT